MVEPAAAVALPQGSSGGGTFLDGAGFLRVLVEELRHQDPLRPVDARDLVSQLAVLRQVEVLEEIRDLLKQVAVKKEG